MPVRVITPPNPIVTPAQIAGDHASDDDAVALLIRAVTEVIDGPSGWLGRALGPQTLELTLDRFGCGRGVDLPCPPIVSVGSVKYLDPDGVEQTFAGENWRLSGRTVVLKPTASWPSIACEPDAVRIRYQAGYSGTGEGETGDVPARAVQAIILSAQHLKSLGVENLYVRADEVEGIGRDEFILSEQASRIVERACDNLLSTLRVYS